MRNAFMEELVCAARVRDDIVLIIGDLGYSVIEPFADEFPDRFFNAGIAEQNMMGMAAGIASEGMRVFTYSIGNFPTWRCAEQIRNDIDYHNLPVTNVVIGSGVTYGSLGYSHHAIQDLAIMRGLPNMVIAAPGDPLEVRACMQYLLRFQGPSYLRLGKAGETHYHMSIPKISEGKWLKVYEGSSNKALLSTGASLQITMSLVSSCEYEDYSVYSIPLWSMASKLYQKKIIEKFERIITFEDHLPDGGFGAWLLESVANEGGLCERIRIRGFDPNVCGVSASQAALNKLGGLS